MEYLVTAHPPTTVSHSVRGRFTSSVHDSLAVVRPSSISLFDLLPSGPVEACKPIELWGRVIGAEVWSPPPPSDPSSIDIDFEGDDQQEADRLAYLLVLLDAPPKPLLLVCRWSAENGTLIVAERVELTRPTGARENEFWQGLIVDHSSGTIAAGIWCGSLSVVVLSEPVAGAAASEGKARPRRGKASVQQGLVKSKYDVQLRDLNLLALVFTPSPDAAVITGRSNPSLAFLTLTPTREPHLRVRELDLTSKDLVPLSEEMDRLALTLPDESAGLLVPIPSAEAGSSGAILVIGEKALSVYDLGSRQPARGTPSKGKSRADAGGLAPSAPGSGKRRRSSAASNTASSSFIGRDGASKVPRLDEEDDEPQASGSNSYARAVPVVGKMPFSEITAWEIVDSGPSEARVLLGDSYGQLKLAILKRGRSGRFESVEVVILGTTSPAKCLTYLTSSHVFVGSHFANSVVVSILSSPIPYVGSYLAPPSASFDNLAPVLDICVSAEGEGEVVTCSGGNGAGSLRIVRDGAGWEQELAIEGVLDVEKVWSLPSPTGPITSSEVLLVASTSFATHLLLLSASDDAMADTRSAPSVTVCSASANAGLDQTRPSIHVGPVGSALAQVTKESVLLVDTSSGSRNEWKPEGHREEIGVATTSQDGLILLGLNGGKLVLLRASLEGLVVVSIRQTHSEVSALTIAGDKAAVASWDLSVLTLDLTSDALDTVSVLPSTPALARSLLFAANCKAEQPSGLIVGLGDGTVVVNLLSADGALLAGSDVRRLNLGSTEVQLTTSVGGSILASCDRPAILQLEDRGRVGYQYVNVKDVSSACSVDVGDSSPSLLLVTPDSLILGRLDSTKKTQIQTIAFGAESPYRIAFHPELRSYGVAFIKSEVDRFREQEVVSSSFKLLDDDFRAVYTYELEAGERATALELVHLRCKTGGESLPVFLLGTAMMQPDHSEVQRGRILLFNVGSDGKLHMSRAIDVAGMVYAFSQVAQDGFAATVNSRVILFTLNPAFDTVGPSPRIMRRSQWASAYLPASLTPVGESLLLVGDAMSSLALIKPNLDSELLTVAKDLKPLWLTSVGAISDTNFVAADVGCNISTFKLVDAELETGGAIHLGDIVNKFRKGSLRPQQQQQQDSHASANLVFAASSGRISVLADLLGPETSHTLFDLQRNMSRVVRGFGGVDHTDWRAYRSDVGSRPSAGFIDGDYVEQFLDVKDEDLILEIMEGASKWERIEVPYGDLCSLLEGLRRLH